MLSEGIIDFRGVGVIILPQRMILERRRDFGDRKIARSSKKHRRNGMLNFAKTVSLVVLALGGAPSLAAAQTPEGYYKNKVVLINIAGTAGGGIDVGARILARYLGKYLPGNPQVLAQNMPGAGGVRVLEYLHSQAPKDGTWIGAFASGPLDRSASARLWHRRFRRHRRHRQGQWSRHDLAHQSSEDARRCKEARSDSGRHRGRIGH